MSDEPECVEKVYRDDDVWNARPLSFGNVELQTSQAP